MAAILAMLLLFLFLWFYYLDAPFVPEEEGIEVALGDYEEGGAEEYIPFEAVPEVVAPAPAAQAAPSTNDLLVQEEEESLALQKQAEEERKRLAAEEALRKKQQQEAELARIEAENKAKEEAAAKKAAEEKAKADKAQRDMAGLFGNNSGDSGSGNSTGSTQQGQPNGSSASLGITGSGPQVSLAGRKYRKNTLVQPVVNNNMEGIVVVKIRVNSEGKVTVLSGTGQGSTTSDPALINAAKESAQKVEFEPQEGAQDAFGTITYKYTLK